MENNQQLLSLYDYLGKPAGLSLGKLVAEAAKINKVKCSTRYVSNPKYKGDVLLYPKLFLDQYFNKNNK